jgi:hypothetical protein
MPRPTRDDDDEDAPPRPRRKPPEAEELGDAVEPAESARRPRPRRDEDYEEDDRPRRPRRREEDDDEDDRPRARRRRNWDDDEDEYDDDRPRRRRKEPIESLIPYHNPKALAAYYCGVFSLIPILGLILGPIALVLGFQGMRFARENESAGGKGHAITGVVLGILTTLGNWGCGLVAGIAFLNAPRYRR